MPFDFKNLSLKITILKKTPWFLAKHNFLVILLFILLAMVLGGALFQSHVVSIGRRDPEVSDSSLKFKDNVYQRVVGQWQADEKKLIEGEDKEYANPFNQ